MCDGERARLEDGAAAERELFTFLATVRGADSAAEMETVERPVKLELAGSTFDHAGCKLAGD